MGFPSPYENPVRKPSLAKRLWDGMIHYRTAVIFSVAAIPISLIWLGIFDYSGFIHHKTGDHIPNPLNPEQDMNLYLTLISPTVSANVPIIESITLTSPSSNDLAESYNVMFLDSSCNPSPLDILVYCEIVVNRASPNSTEYHGNGKLFYTSDGDFNVKLRALSSPSFINNLETSAKSDFIRISPREAAIDFLNTKIGFTIGIVGVAATVATIDRKRSKH